LFRCEKCNIELDNFNWRLILSVNVVDMTDNQWVQCFQEQGEDILGIKAQELGDLLISDKEAYDKVFEVFGIYNELRMIYILKDDCELRFFSFGSPFGSA